MDSELKSFIKVWICTLTCLCYCYYVASRFPKGLLRLISILPIFCLFLKLPLELTSFHLGGPTAFFLVWLASFKLLLFSFDQGPLTPTHHPSVLHFISLACLPIKFKQDPLTKAQNYTIQSQRERKSLDLNSHKYQENRFPKLIPKWVLLAIKAFILGIIFQCYNYRQQMHPYVTLGLYCLNMYLELELILALTAILAQILFGLELEPQFNEPYLATSLQDFWGYRWNLMVTNILRPTVYNPCRNYCEQIIGPLRASLLSMVATFVVSGLMHELIYFYITRVTPTWEVTWFFVLHGIAVAVEVMVKKVVGGRWQLHRAVSGPLTIMFLAITGIWLFFPQLIRNHVDDKAIEEYSIFVDFLKAKSDRALCLVLESSKKK